MQGFAECVSVSGLDAKGICQADQHARSPLALQPLVVLEQRISNRCVAWLVPEGINEGAGALADYLRSLYARDDGMAVLLDRATKLRGTH
ncbi:MAG TPA: hypothetical protein DHU96_12235 [Actinobacteria bacterium]|nr:hypothetical protein [Actinomycetota bacterium]